MFKKVVFSILVAVSAFSVSAQEQANPIVQLFSSGGEKSYCLAIQKSDIDECPNNHLMLFAPISWGNSQFPLHVIAEYCDTEKPVIFNESGVVCTKVAHREGYNVLLEKQKTPWRILKKDVAKENSGWTQFNDTGWVKILQKGSGTLPPLPYKMTLSFQRLDVEGKPIGKVEKEVEEIEEKNNAFYKDYPVGTEFEAVWFNEDLLDSVRRKYKVEKIEPIQEQAQKTQDSNSSGKKKQ